MTLLVFLTFLLIKSATLKEMKDMNVEEILRLFEKTLEVRPYDVKPDDVTFYLFTRNSSNQQIYTNSHKIIAADKKSKILIHGWLGDHKTTWYRNITEEYLKKGDFNIIQVDWKRVAHSSYVSSAQNTKFVGKFVADLVLYQKLNLQNVHLIGHSLGAHVAAFTAKEIKRRTGKKVARITGLDPAGPYFRNVNIKAQQRLNADDAQIVDVIHTDGGFYGYYKAIGTLDIYINGGTRIQPECLGHLEAVPIGQFIQQSFCSHVSSVTHFIETINKKKFICHKCDSWTAYLEGLCNSNKKYVFGAEDVTKNMTGMCFVKT